MPDKPEQPPEGAAIQRAMIRTRLSARQAATQAGMSEGRWRQIVSGYQSARGAHIPVTAPAATLARMAQAVGLTSRELTEAGRQDAAEILDDLTSRPTTADPLTADLASDRDEALRKVMLSDLPDDQKRRIAQILIEQKRDAERQRVANAEQLIRFARGED